MKSLQDNVTVVLTPDNYATSHSVFTVSINYTMVSGKIRTGLQMPGLPVLHLRSTI